MRIPEYLEGYDLMRFRGDRKTSDAVQRCMACITEAIIQMGEATAQEVGLAIPFAEVRGLGNKLRHEYRRIKDDVIDKTARANIRPLRDASTTCALAAE